MALRYSNYVPPLVLLVVIFLSITVAQAPAGAQSTAVALLRSKYRIREPVDLEKVLLYVCSND
jgi:hypothetical protein